MTQIDKKLEEYFAEYAKELGCTVEEAKEAIREQWGEYGLRGYAVFSNGVSFEGVDCICRIDEMDIYDSDIEAAKQAARDGVKLIPYKEQPKFYPFNCYRFIDTPDNRVALQAAYDILYKE